MPDSQGKLDPRRALREPIRKPDRSEDGRVAIKKAERGVEEGGTRGSRGVLVSAS